MPLDGTLYHPQDEILRVLSAAQERIREPENWCQGTMWRTTDNDVKQWCARGAVYWTYNEKNNDEADNLLNRAANEMGYSNNSKTGRNAIVLLNNTTDHPTVMAMFSRAIELRLADMAKEAVHAAA